MAVTTIVALFGPTAVPLIGIVMFGNLIKEIGSDTSRLFDAAANCIMNAATIFLGLSVGATLDERGIPQWTTIGIVVGGFLAFALSISGGICLCETVQSVLQEDRLIADWCDGIERRAYGKPRMQ